VLIIHCPSPISVQAVHEGFYPSLFSVFSLCSAPLSIRLFDLRPPLTLHSIAGFVCIFANTERQKRSLVSGSDGFR
jgi:hypothetical protein